MGKKLRVCVTAACDTSLPGLSESLFTAAVCLTTLKIASYHKEISTLPTWRRQAHNRLYEFARDSAIAPCWWVHPVFGPRGSRSSSLSVIITDHPSYTIVDCRWLTFSGRRCPCLEGATAPRHVGNVPFSFLVVFWRLIFQAFISRLFVDVCEVARHCQTL